MSEPLLSVCLITYNHAQYIREAIDSVLMQKVDFTWELIIADDFSTDGTREIVLEYARNYPAFIKLILQERNVGAAKNWMDLMAAPSGKYIAYFEGDDFWIDPNRLQKQVDYLEDHPECALCFHDVRYEDSTGDLKGFPTYSSRCELLKENTDATFTIRDTLMGGLIPTCSVVLRNEPDIRSLPGFFYQSVTGDWLLWLLACKDRTMHYFHQTMAVYRITPGGSSFYIRRNMDALYYNRVQMLMELDRHWNFQLHDVLTPAIRRYARLTPLPLWSDPVIGRFARYSPYAYCRIRLKKNILHPLFSKVNGILRCCGLYGQ